MSHEQKICLIYNDIYEIIKLEVQEIPNKCYKCLAFFQETPSHTLAEFLLNGKIIIIGFGVFHNVTKLSIKEGIRLFYKQYLKNLNHLNALLSKLKCLNSESYLSSAIFAVYFKDDINFTPDNVYIKSLNVDHPFICESGHVVQFLIEYIESELNKSTINLHKATRQMFVKISFPLPFKLDYYDDQVGGHGLIFDSEMKLLKFHKAVFKPIQKFPKGKTELLFYEELYGLKSNENFSMLKKIVPKYIGFFLNSVTKEHDMYIGLKDALHKFQHPSVIDIKLGQVTYEPDANPLKVTLEKAKYFWREEIGFLITGIKVYRSDSPEPLYLDRYYGLTLDPVTVYEKGLVVFISGHSERCRLAKCFIEKLNNLLQWFESQEKYNFYSTSLLLAYDSNQRLETKDVVVKMIDFTHIRVENKKDLNSIYGLKSLISYFNKAIV